MITLQTIGRFLTFDEQAVKTIARSRQATLVGFLLVISAGFAREYDGEYLLAEPWHLLLPLLASLLGALVLTVLVWMVACTRKVNDVGFAKTFHAILNVYWMTAPLAWLYAIPVERFLSPGVATRANLLLLAIVAVWRVAIMVRCISIIYKARWIAALMPVMVFSDGLALAALKFVPGPIFMIMGGVRLTESESIILGIRLQLGLLGVLSAPVWLIGFLIVCSGSSPWKWQLANDAATADDEHAAEEQPQDQQRDSPTGDGISLGLWLLLAASLLIWIPILPFTQAEQKLRWQAENLLRSDQFAEVCRQTREHEADDYPPHWDPPPRLGYGEREPNLIAATIALKSCQPADWFWKLYLDKLESQSHWLGQYYVEDSLKSFSDSELEQYVNLVTQLENGPRIAAGLRGTIEWELKRDNDPDNNDQLTDSRRASFERLLQLYKSKDP